MGLTYCAQKWEVEEQERLADEIQKLKVFFGLKNSLLDSAYMATMRFLDAKVWNEEGHDGSGYAMWAQSSLSEQREEYLVFLSELRDNHLPSVANSFKVNDKRLNVNYKNIMNELKLNPIYRNMYTIDAEGFRETQRLWISYRDRNTALLIAISNRKYEDFWNNYFTVKRLEEFETLEERISWE